MAQPRLALARLARALVEEREVDLHQPPAEEERQRADAMRHRAAGLRVQDPLPELPLGTRACASTAGVEALLVPQVLGGKRYGQRGGRRGLLMGRRQRRAALLQLRHGCGPGVTGNASLIHRPRDSRRDGAAAGPAPRR
jgi:hypothetical protein